MTRGHNGLALLLTVFLKCYLSFFIHKKTTNTGDFKNRLGTNRTGGPDGIRTRDLLRDREMC